MFSYKILFFSFFFLFSLVTTIFSITNLPTKRVLILHSYYHESDWTREIHDGIETVFHYQSQFNIEDFSEHMDFRRYEKGIITNLAYRYYRDKYRGMQFDAILLSDNDALDFMLAYGDEIFPNTPVVFCAINNFRKEMLLGKTNYTGVVENIDILATLEIAFRLNPSANHVIAFVSTDKSGLQNLSLLSVALVKINRPFTYRFYTNASLEEAINIAKNADIKSFIIYTGLIYDKQGLPIDFFNIPLHLSPVSKTPIYNFWKSGLGNGVVGGKLVDPILQGKYAAEMVLQLLSGRLIEDIPIMTDSPNRYYFDNEILKRYQLDTSVIPSNAIIINEDIPVIYRYSELFALIFVVLLIALASILVYVFVSRINSEKLKKQLEFQQLLIDSIPNPVFVKDNMGLYINCNLAFEAYLGKSKNEILGKTVFDLSPKREAEIYHQKDLEILKTKVTQVYESRVLNSDNTFHDVIFYKSVFKDEHQRVKGIIGVILDITLLKNIEMENQLLNDELNLLLDNTEIQICYFKDPTTFGVVNKALADFYGLNKDDIAYHKISDVIDEENAAKIIREVAPVFESGESVYLESSRRNKNDEERIFTYFKIPKLDHNGRVQYVVSSAIDITDKIKYQKAVAESEERFNQTLNAIEEGLWEYNHSDNTVFFSERFTEMTGIHYDNRPQSLEDLLKFIHPSQMMKYKEKYESHQVFQNDTIHDEVLIRGKVGKWIWIEINGKVLSRDENQNPTKISGVIKNINEKKILQEKMETLMLELQLINIGLEKRIEEELSKSREKDEMMMVQSRQAALGEMIGNIAHQWRQPINTVGLILQNMREAYSDKRLDGIYIEKAVEHGMKIILYMSQTIDDFRYFFRPNREKELFSLDDTIQRALTFIDASFKDHRILLVYEKTSDVNIFGFPNEYSQTLLNILNNARDILIERAIEKPSITVRLSENQADSKYHSQVTITDNGGGIDKDIIGKVFDPYFTTREHGTGIGLYMSKTIIEKNMNGKLSVRNTENGAEFIIEV